VISARAGKTNVSLGKALEQIHSIAAHVEQKAQPKSSSCKAANFRLKAANYLLIEGSGGLLVPLGEGYTVLDLIAKLKCEVVVVSRNLLGTINHTLLTLRVLGQGIRANRSHPFSRPASVVLTDTAERDISCRTNPTFLAELIDPTPLVRLPYLGRRPSTPQSVIKNAQKLRNVLNAVLGLNKPVRSP
jgi:dethiobiotin synthetase